VLLVLLEPVVFLALFERPFELFGLGTYGPYVPFGEVGGLIGTPYEGGAVGGPCGDLIANPTGIEGCGIEGCGIEGCTFLFPNLYSGILHFLLCLATVL
jgi:hypothetical protein